MGWIKLVEGNDWGVKFHAPYSCPGTWSRQRDGVLSNAGKCVRVRWPDGSETQELVGTASRSQGIYDHGHQYTAHGTYDVLLVQQRGVFVPVELTSVELWEAEWPRASDARSPEPADGKAGADAAGDGGGTCR